MAIVDNTNVKGAASAQVQNPALSAPGTLKVDSNSSFASSSDNPFGNMAVHIGAGNMAFSPIPRMGAEEYEKLAKTFREIAKEVENKNNAIEVKVLYLDRSFAPALHFEGFVVATTSRAKPDIGVGAANTFFIEDDAGLDRFFATKPPVDYIMEEYVRGYVQTYDAIVDSKGQPLFESGNITPFSLMDTVNNNLDSVYYLVKELPENIHRRSPTSVLPLGSKK